MSTEGILLVNKAKKRSSFSLVALLRKITHVQKIGHTGTLDPFATGVMIMLLGKQYTIKSDQFLNMEKEYLATLYLGKVTETFDSESPILDFSDKIPSLEEIEESLPSFNGSMLQTPPMYSAKKVKGKKLYHLARKGIIIERAPVKIELTTTLLSYSFPFLKLKVKCSKGTYIRTLAHDLGQKLGCGAYLSDLNRTRCGPFLIEHCLDHSLLEGPNSLDLIQKYLRLC